MAALNIAAQFVLGCCRHGEIRRAERGPDRASSFLLSFLTFLETFYEIPHPARWAAHTFSSCAADASAGDPLSIRPRFSEAPTGHLSGRSGRSSGQFERACLRPFAR